MLIDTHNHLYFDQFDGDRDEALARMAAAGVQGAVVIGIDSDSWVKARDLAQQYPQLRYAVGLHPTSEFVCKGGAMERFIGEEFAILLDGDPAPVAIGECGIDLHWRAGDPRVTWAVNPLEEQQLVFGLQLRFAAKADKPVIVHTRDADRETLACLEEVPGTRGVLHCYNGSRELLEFALAHEGWYVSFAGNVTYPKAAALHSAARDLPLSKLLVETDAPFVTPVPHRGERNEPAYVRHTAEFIARLRGISLEELAEATTANAGRLFRTAWALR
jgi:TatD DNase family protein